MSNIHELYLPDDIYGIIKEAINAMQNENSAISLNFFAIAGFGKSEFLRLLSERLRAQYLVTLTRAEEFDDFNRELIKIIKQIRNKLASPSISDFLTDNVLEQLNRPTLKEQLIKLIKNAENQTAIIFLFDDYDRLPQHARDLFEDDLFGELLKTKKTLFILTSVREINFASRLFLRMRLKTHQLPACSQETIANAFPELKDSASAIHAITGGMPEPTAKLIDYIEQSEQKTVSQELIARYYQHYVKTDSLQQIQPEDRQKIALALSCLRRLGVSLLKAVLPNVCSEHYASDTKTREYLQLIEDFLIKGILYWRDTTAGGYALQDSLRTLFNGYALIEAPELYRQIHQCAFEFYKKKLETEYREQDLIEFLYHAINANLWKEQRQVFPESIKVSQLFFDELKGELGAIKKVGEKERTSLLKMLEDDKEIQTILPNDNLMKLFDEFTHLAQ